MNRRRDNSTKMTNIVHAGWMTKSPPEGKLNTPFKIFRSQWKRRYFVLRKPSGSLPDQYELNYYKDDRCSNKKGAIDLEQCEQIISSLDSDQYPNLLSIKTVYKSKDRTYYLAAESQNDMCTWVEWLCHVCGLKQEEQPTDIPDPKPVTSTATSRSTISMSAGQTASPPLVTGFVTATPPQTLTQFQSTPSSFGSPFTSESKDLQYDSRSSSPTSYIHLDKCTTGAPVRDRASSEEIPDYNAPPPPKQVPMDGGDEDDVFLNQRPPAPKDSVPFDLYKVPPTRSNNDPCDSYDVPPPRRREARARPPSYGNRTNSGTSSVDAAESYDYPPPRLDSTTSSEGDQPPERPPRPPRGDERSQHYANLPSDLNAVLPPPRPHQSVQIGYDIPRSSLASRPNVPMKKNNPSSVISLSTVTPPPPRPHKSPATGGHAYLNAPPRPTSSELKNSSSDTDASSDPSDPSDVAPAVPPSRQPANDTRSVSPLYQNPPPPSGPPRPPARMIPPAPLVSSTSSDNGPLNVFDDNTCNIFSTTRTQSFKRHHNINNNLPSQSQKSKTLPSMNISMSATVPVPRQIHSSRAHHDSTDDDEEATHHPISLLHSVPGPPSDSDNELKYIDLDLGPDNSSRASHSSSSHIPNHSHHSSHSHIHVERPKEQEIQYRTIDFVKTTALMEAQIQKEKERKSDDHK